MIHICYALSDKQGNYSKFAGASICSILENTCCPVTVHILHDGTISKENGERFGKLAQAYHQEIIFYDVPQLMADTLAKGRDILPAGWDSRRYTEVNMYRLALGEVLPEPVERVIFLDADTIINMDIEELWQAKTGATGLGAVPDWSVLEHFGKTNEISESNSFLYAKGYATMQTIFNAGVLLLDLTIIRKQGNLLLRGLQFLADNDKQWDFYDNDILIAFFAKEFYHLPWNYNIRVSWAQAFAHNHLDKGIYHYVDRNYGLNPTEVYHQLFLSFLWKTPWADEHTLYGAYQVSAGYTMTQAARRLAAIRQINNNSRGKKRVLMGLAVDESRLRKDFALGQEEKFVLLAPGRKLALDYPVQEYYYLVFWSNYPEVKALMEGAGLREYQDFADGRLLMPEQTSDLVLNERNLLWSL